MLYEENTMSLFRLHNLALLPAVALMMTPATVTAGDLSTGTLTVHVSGFENAKGHAIINLFCEEQDVMQMDAACLRTKSVIENGQASFTFPRLPFGTYAISVFHDVNDNGKLDHKMGIPSEPLGFSNSFHLSVFSGLPNFEKLKFVFREEGKAIEIRLR
jgi:uncharacterized protein (DUF2141 family)